MRKLLVVGVLCVLLGGCTTMSPAKKAYAASALADVATMAYGLENCPYAGEKNYLVPDSASTAQAVITASLVKILIYKLSMWQDNPQPWLWTFAGGSTYGTVRNLQVIDGCAQ